MGIKKTQNFTLILNLLKKFKKNTKKVISKHVTEICTFFTFTHVRQTCFAFNFFGAFLKNFFIGFEISINFSFFYIFLTFFRYFILGHISTFYKL